jgi:CheY-like chemotaxis protein
MPELEGVDVTRALRSDAELRERPVILISSCDEGEVEWRDAGANCSCRSRSTSLT